MSKNGWPCGSLQENNFKITCILMNQLMGGHERRSDTDKRIQAAHGRCMAKTEIMLPTLG
jgi:hypothetical protein